MTFRHLDTHVPLSAFNYVHLALNVMRQSAYLVFNPIMVENYAAFFNCRLYDGPDIKLFILVGWGRSFLSVAWPTVFLLLRS